MKNEAKKIQKKDAKKRVTISQNCFGEIIKIRTVKTCVGNPIIKSGKCKKCIDTAGDTALVCFCKAGYDKVKKVKKVKKSRKSRSEKPFNTAICLWIAGVSKKELQKFLQNYGLSNNAAKKFAGDIFLLGNAVLGKSRKKNGLIAKYIQYSLYGVGEEPTGCRSTIGFCKNYLKEYKTFTI
jgi:hypothetical protein